MAMMHVGHPREIAGKNKVRPLFSYEGFSVQSQFKGAVLGSGSLVFLDRESCHLAIEVFNVGGWLTH